jgi:hypothetical protein
MVGWKKQGKTRTGTKLTGFVLFLFGKTEE